MSDQVVTYNVMVVHMGDNVVPNKVDSVQYCPTKAKDHTLLECGTEKNDFSFFSCPAK